MDAIQIQGLNKAFKSGWWGKPPVQTLKNLSLTVRRGEIFGFLGPNGAGKTTTIKILMGLMRGDSGTVEIFGLPAGSKEARRKVGFLPEGPYFYNYLTAQEFLKFYGTLAGIPSKELRPRIDSLLELVGMTHARDRQLRKFSKGMLQRVGLAQAIIHDPDLVILDEPMSGLDPIGRKEVRDLILRLREEGKTIFFSSHIIPDVEMICDRVGILLKGELYASGEVEELMNRGHSQSVEIVCEGLESQELSSLRKYSSKIFQKGRRAMIILPGAEMVDEVVGMIKTQRGTLVSLNHEKGSLEELFVQEPHHQTKEKVEVCGR